MGMRLTPQQLIEVAKKVEEIGDVTGLEVSQVMFAEHRIFLSKVEGGYQIVGISNEVNKR